MKLDTGYPEVNNILSTLLPNLQNVLQDNLVGVYLFGSLVWGDFDIINSDIDVFVALNQELSKYEFAALDKIHKDLTRHFPSWDDRIEVAYASTNFLKNFKTEVGKIAVISPGEPFHIKDAGTDWLINYYLLQSKSLVMYGPDAKSIIAPVSKNEFLDNVKNQAIEWQDWIVHTKQSLGYQYYAILTLCRALYVLKYHEQPSKLKAGSWAITQYPKWKVLIQNAMNKNRLSDAKSDYIEMTYHKVTSFVEEMIQRILNDEL